MGLFDKTTNCKKCGKPFSKGMFSTEKLCPECSWVDLLEVMKANSIAKQREGITTYYKDMPKKFRMLPADVDTIISARNKIFEKYRRDDIMTTSVLRNALTANTGWDDEQKVMFAVRVLNAAVNTQNRMSFVLNRFVISHMYDGVAVDMDSVFAVAYTKNLFFKSDISEQPYLCALFTNDPYFPAIGMTFLPVTSKSFLAMERTKNKDRVEHLKEILPKIFPNLKYPVMDMKDMKKLVKNEGQVRDNSMNYELMLDLLGNGLSSPFWGIDSIMPETMPSGIATAIQDYGYVSISDVITWLGLEDRAIRKSWKPYIDEAALRIEQVEDELREYIMTNNDLFE